MNSAQPSIGPGSPLKYLVISIIWSFFFFTFPRPRLRRDHDSKNGNQMHLKFFQCKKPRYHRTWDPWGFSSFLSPQSRDKFPSIVCFLKSDAIFSDLDLHMAGIRHLGPVPILSVFTIWCQVSSGPRLSPHTTPLESKSVKLPSPSPDDFSKAHLESYIDPLPPKVWGIYSLRPFMYIFFFPTSQASSNATSNNCECNR